MYIKESLVLGRIEWINKVLVGLRFIPFHFSNDRRSMS